MLRSNPNKVHQTLSDEALLDAYVRHGSATHLGILYERYMPMVYGVCLKVLKKPDLAEDAVMNIYEELTYKVREHRIESFRGWLYVLARNHSLMQWRKNQRHPTDSVAPDDMHRFDAVEAAFEVELPDDKRPLEKCLAELNDWQRRCVQLFYYENQSYKTIADLLQEELGQVRSHIQNGRRNLKLCLEKAGVNTANLT
ncbi:MAG: RNA polymerase sigma factor [Saprospiraceae bacterium]